MDSVYETINDITKRLDQPSQASGEDQSAPPITVHTASSPLPFFTWVFSPALQGLVGTGLVLVLLSFMLTQREDLRNRFIRLLGNGNLTRITRAVEDGVSRISHFLLMQIIVNAAFGTCLGIGLFLIGVPFAAVWGFLAAILRYIPYIGTWIAAVFPVCLSIALLPGWTPPVLVLGLFLVLDLTAAYFVEPWVFGSSIGVSPVALLIAATFWGWLWGPIGLVISTPLTACLAVLGRYVPAFEFFAVLLSDQPVLPAHVVLYQRLLARDLDEASDLVEEYGKTHSAAEVYDQVLVPALVLAKENRDDGDFSPQDERNLHQAMSEILDGVPLRDDASDGQLDGQTTLVLGCPAHDEFDRLALVMFHKLLDSAKCRFEVLSDMKLSSEVLAQVEHDSPAVLCIASLPPGGLAHIRYLCKRLRARAANLKILVGYWGLEHNQSRVRERLLETGADNVSTTLAETKRELLPLVQVHTMAARRRIKPALSSSER
jgi:predicted PurR-regulated permease PerM